MKNIILTLAILVFSATQATASDPIMIRKAGTRMDILSNAECIQSKPNRVRLVAYGSDMGGQRRGCWSYDKTKNTINVVYVTRGEILNDTYQLNEFEVTEYGKYWMRGEEDLIDQQRQQQGIDLGKLDWSTKKP